MFNHLKKHPFETRTLEGKLRVKELGPDQPDIGRAGVVQRKAGHALFQGAGLARRLTTCSNTSAICYVPLPPFFKRQDQTSLWTRPSMDPDRCE